MDLKEYLGKEKRVKKAFLDSLDCGVALVLMDLQAFLE